MDHEALQGAPDLMSPRDRLHGAFARWAAVAGTTPMLVVAGLISSGLAFGAKEACRAGAWNVGVEQYQAHCYTDIYPLYFTEGISSGKIPYLDHPVEYPVLIGAVMEVMGLAVRSISNPFSAGLQYFDITVALLAIFLIAGVLATAYCAGPGRRWTALLVAFSPAFILSAYINWDLIAMGLTMLALAAWAARRPALAGVLLGLAVATKFYPVVVLWPLFLLSLRAGQLRVFRTAALAAAGAWLVVNLPVLIIAPHGWAYFYEFSSDRGADWGAIWYYLEYLRWPVLGSYSLSTLNLLSTGAFALACAGITLLALAAPRRPRLAQLAFLITAAFLLSNKVWSPQYVVWLVPLAVLARPRLIGYAVWQIAEVGYFYAIWAYLITVSVSIHTPGAIGADLYFAAVLARFGTVLLLCFLVVRDCLQPERDVVRAGGADDPAGGVLDGAPDRLRLSIGWRRAPAAA
jgi:uncharacterized membrane protein